MGYKLLKARKWGAVIENHGVHKSNKCFYNNSNNFYILTYIADRD